MLHQPITFSGVIAATFNVFLSHDASPSKRTALRRLLGQQRHRLSSSSPLNLQAVDYRCASLAHGLLQLFEFFADMKHHRRATVASSRTFFLCVVALSPPQLKEPRCIAMTTSPPSASTTSSPASPSHPCLLRPLRQPWAASASSSSLFFCVPQPSLRLSLLVPSDADTRLGPSTQYVRYKQH